MTVIKLTTVRSCDQQNCVVINGTAMTCPSPAMNSLQLPPASGRRKRQDTRFINEVITNLEFYIGFKLDGFTKYENLSDALPSQQTIDVSYDPIILQFTEPDMLRWYSNPAQGNYISILVSGLRGLDVEESILEHSRSF
jgi:hypothetical protein